MKLIDAYLKDLKRLGIDLRQLGDQLKTKRSDDRNQAALQRAAKLGRKK